MRAIPNSDLNKKTANQTSMWSREKHLQQTVSQLNRQQTSQPNHQPDHQIV